MFDPHYYHFFVSAWNGVGSRYGKRQHSTPASISPCSEPDAPKDIIVKAFDKFSYEVIWTEPLNSGGSPIEKYLVEWVNDTGKIEVQRITITATSAISGSFRLSIAKHETVLIPFGCSTTELKEALEGLSNVGELSITNLSLKDHT